MRPTAGGITFDGEHQPRKQSDHVHRPQVNAGPSAFFLATESDLARRSQEPQSTSPGGTFKETLDILNNESKIRHEPRETSRRRSTIRPRSIEELRGEAVRQHGSNRTSPSIFAMSSATSQVPSLPGSPKSVSSRSLPRSEQDTGHDDNSSQAVESDEEDNAGAILNSMLDSAPQLIMPSISIPSRRPFTERGRQMSKFKIMVVGSKGSGKTSLIKSTVQVCEDIVHVDPLASGTTTSSRHRSIAASFSETYASTRPYPSWWSDIDESKVLKRRKSMGDTVLERNICFVDSCHDQTPAYSAHYIEQQIIRAVNSTSIPETDLISLLSGRGGSQVDLVLYLLTHATLQDDLVHLQQLGQITNVVPLISKSDLLTPDEIQHIRDTISADRGCIPRLPISFSQLSHTPAQASSPYTVSCVNGPDYDNMDASLLMSSDYLQPLLPSELALLMDQILSPENIPYFRHTAAKKLIQWYNSGSRLEDSMRTPSPSSVRMRSPISSTLNSPFQTSLAASNMLVPVISHSDLSINTSNSFALARVADHTQKEDRLAQIRLSKWASDLQLSLQREREKYESLARSERAVWLVEKMGEEIREGQLVPTSELPPPNGNRRRAKESNVKYQLHDPLGLLRWQDTVRAQTWLALQIVGSFGVVGGLALWITKQWGYDTSLHQWARDWGLWHD